MDSIDVARAAMERADDAFERALAHGLSTIAALDALAQEVADTEEAYYRACDLWEPAAV